MKQTVCMFFILAMIFNLAACGGGKVDNVEVPDWKPSEIYTDTEIEAAIKTVKEYFKKEFDGCTLTKVGYVGDTFADEFAARAEQYNADEAIILYSSFDVDSSGGDGSLNPNSTYDDWQWILIRNVNGEWRHADHGYG